MARPKARWFLYGLLVAAGALAGVSAGIAAFYTKPFVMRLDSVKRKLGLDSYFARYDTGLNWSTRDLRWKFVASPAHPEWNVAPGFDVELAAEGFTYPVSLAFATDPGGAPDAPLYYVAELDGRIRYVGRDGRVGTYAEGFKNVAPFPLEKSDELGLVGLTTLAGSEDLVITHAHRDPGSGMLTNRVVRLVSEPGGRAMREARVLLDLGEVTTPSHQIQSVIQGPDGMLYVSVGDGEAYTNALDLSKYGGKILRMDPDGAPCEDNPLHEPYAGPGGPRDYIYAYGIRNAFDMAFQPGTGRMFSAENGEDVDRLFEVLAGAGYGWDGTADSTRLNALYTWGPEPNNVSPVGMVFPSAPVLGEGSAGRCYIGLYGDAYTVGPGTHLNKAIVEAQIDPETGLLARVPRPILQYDGPHKATVLDLAEGPDGLYFTDFFGAADSVDVRGTGRVWRLVPSEETLGMPPADEAALAAMDPERRGLVFFAQNCATCHSLDGRGGNEGPGLDNVAAVLRARLASEGYVTTARKLLGDPAAAAHAGRIEEVLAAEPGPGRVRAWLHHHLEDPRFDNPHGKMPSFELALTDEQREDIIAFLMARP